MHWNFQAICHGLWNSHSGALPVWVVAEQMFTGVAKVPCKPYKWCFTNCYTSMVTPGCLSSPRRGAIPGITRSRTEPSPSDNCSVGLPVLSVFWNVSSALWGGQTSLMAAQQSNSGFGSHTNLPPRPLPSPTETWATLGYVYKNYAKAIWLLTLFSSIWGFPSWAPCSKQTWMVVISEAARTLCDLASSLEFCFATSPRNHVRKPHMLSDVTQYLRRVIVV